MQTVGIGIVLPIKTVQHTNWQPKLFLKKKKKTYADIVTSQQKHQMDEITLLRQQVQELTILKQQLNVLVTELNFVKGTIIKEDKLCEMFIRTIFNTKQLQTWDEISKRVSRDVKDVMLRYPPSDDPSEASLLRLLSPPRVQPLISSSSSSSPSTIIDNAHIPPSITSSQPTRRSSRINKKSQNIT